MQYILIVMFMGGYVETTNFQELNSLQACERIATRINIESKAKHNRTFAFCSEKGVVKNNEKIYEHR